ncbi:MAG: HPr family phosphocarrier protein [Acidobacteriota bacterium]|nr:HPr family phosphocarrier protein [Acidobacteriota bacterium]
MRRIELVIQNRLGLHARAAAKFVHLANEFSASIGIEKGQTRVNGKSILGLLTLAAACGCPIVLTAEGDDEGAAADTLAALVNSRFGEDD